MVFQAMVELYEGDRVLNGIGSGVWVCGSARTKPGTKNYELGVEVGAALAAAGFAVFTGGGPGAMEAANKGAKQNGGVSVGVGIVLPNEQQFNLELTIKFLCKYFFIRKVLLTKHTEALVVLPGGNGSMDELYEVLTLVQTKTIPPRPIVLVGRKYWKRVDAFSRKTMLPNGMISLGDPDLVKVVNTVGEVMDLMPKHAAS
ncbi:uncharacterized protein (TIGR00730 family) [Actinomadura coerulea]|uniref:Cytokinin riboside 5'-monophosphate phosphoribohydrolase n=1 Tax=Actinomadura coerulea TaxID=46159 RepID=A0A7X0G1Z1_9ACTN|nr:TIGR00730 family Rossman fold protein [Actinomadura coerulea]MBB6397944.1 uncharacterized protein (TIGR00730 family) [Actinomadura coerulea]